MSLNDEERKTLVELQMQKANRFLEQAEMVRGLQQWVRRPVDAAVLRQ